MELRIDVTTEEVEALARGHSLGLVDKRVREAAINVWQDYQYERWANDASEDTLVATVLLADSVRALERCGMSSVATHQRQNLKELLLASKYPDVQGVYEILLQDAGL